MLSNMPAVKLFATRIVYSEVSFAELVLWRLPKPLPGCAHCFKYRLAYIVRGTCVLRYDNEAGKGDHRHYAGREASYSFSGQDDLLADFRTDIARWSRENSDA